MAQPLPTQQEFRYQRVELFKAETLGVGSYGAVCKARCDELPCAAKILHPVMFQFNDPGALAFLRKFEQECQFLRTIKHPNIVQYVATSRDPETGLPVLLMELMDESLTSFLERPQQPLPYHTQVNLCYDIALALAYLHSNGIVHRDLSSNNVLLIAGSRAKVTDFGMSKLIDTNPRMTPLTKCPGTLVYMSPEALRDPPVYSEKLDCFSEGVLTIQMITRQFPSPGPAMRMMQDPRYPRGRVHVEVPETERRRSHIDLIDPTHPLLPLIFRCLEDNSEDRPSAQELCRSLATFKETPAYAQSVQQAQERGTEQIQTLQQQLQEKEQQLQEKDQQLLAKDAILAENEREVHQLRQQLQERDHMIETQVRQTAEREREFYQLRQQTTQQLQEKDRVIENRERQLQANEQVTAEFQQNLLRREREVRNLEERLSEKERLDQQLQKQLKISDSSSAKQKAIGKARKNTELKWMRSPEPKDVVFYTQPVVDGKAVYFRSGNEILAYDSETEQWAKLPECPYDNYALAVVSGLVTTIGGNWYNPTNKLFSLTGEGRKRKWVEHFPPMPTKGCSATALCTERYLIVAGKRMDLWTTNKVEVMNVDTLQWTTASSLPHPLSRATATLLGDDVYMLGGFGQDGKASRSVFKCSLNALLHSSDSHHEWQQVADLPVTQSAGATLQGRLLAIGGKDSRGEETTDAVHEYNPVTDSWEVVSHMPTPSYRCAVAVLPGNRLMVAARNTVQIGTLQ